MNFNDLEAPKSRSEKILMNILGAEYELEPPKSRIEVLLLALKEKIEEGLTPSGSIFQLKGEVDNVVDLPDTGNTVGDVWYVVEKSAGYVWLVTTENPDGYWEELGEVFDLANAPNIFFPIDPAHITFSQVSNAYSIGKIPIIKTSDRNYYCITVDSNGAYFVSLLNYDDTTAYSMILKSNDQWEIHEASFAVLDTLQKVVTQVTYTNPSYSTIYPRYSNYGEFLYMNYNGRTYVALDKTSTSLKFYSIDDFPKIYGLTLNNQNEWSSTVIDLSALGNSDAVLYTSQNLTGAEKLQARSNIAAASMPLYSNIVIETTDWDTTGSTPTCTKTVNGMTVNAIVWLAYSDTETEFTCVQGTDSLTFTCDSVPSADVTVSLTFMEGSASTPLNSNGWNLIKEITLTENTKTVDITADTNGNPFSYDELRVYIIGSMTGVTSANVYLNGETLRYIRDNTFMNRDAADVSESITRCTFFPVEYGFAGFIRESGGIVSVNGYSTVKSTSSGFIKVTNMTSYTAVKFDVSSASGAFVSGTRFIVEGRNVR